MTISIPLIAALAALPLVLTAAAAGVRGRRHLRRSSWRAAAQVEKAAAESSHPNRAELATTKRWHAVHDALLRRSTKRMLRRLAALTERLHHQLVTLNLRAASACQALEQHLRTRERAAEHGAPHMSAHVVAVAGPAAFVGDLAVTTMAITASSPELVPALAAVASLAISAALFVLGKTLGKVLTTALLDKEHWTKAAIGLAIVLFAMTTSLAMLRAGSPMAWLVLAMTPAIAAGCVTALGPQPVHKTALTARREWRRERRGLRRPLAALGKTMERVARAHTGVATALVRELTAEEQAIAAEAGIVVAEPTGPLTSTIRTIQSVAAELGIALREQDLVDIERALGNLNERVHQVSTQRPRASVSTRAVAPLYGGDRPQLHEVGAGDSR